MWTLPFGLDWQRQRILRNTAPGPLRDFLSTPVPDRNTDFRSIEIVSLDLETTGLDPKTDEILSVGMVSLQHMQIRLATARHLLAVPTCTVPEGAAIIHQITDDQAAGGAPLTEVLPQILANLAGKVLLGHHASLDIAFLDAACRRLYGSRLLLPWICTESLIRRWMLQRDLPITDGGLRLHALRAQYGLPRYKAHNALTDAVATAELFCAFAARQNIAGKIPLRRFLR